MYGAVPKSTFASQNANVSPPPGNPSFKQLNSSFFHHFTVKKQDKKIKKEAAYTVTLSITVKLIYSHVW